MTNLTVVQKNALRSMVLLVEGNEELFYFLHILPFTSFKAVELPLRIDYFLRNISTVERTNDRIGDLVDHLTSCVFALYELGDIARADLINEAKMVLPLDILKVPLVAE